jgi:putative endonuclease
MIQKKKKRKLPANNVKRKGVRNQLGQHGETLAAEFLVEKGYVLIARNQTLRVGEVDILARDGAIIVLVEVKTQTSALYSDPVYKVGPAKQRKLLLLARVVSAQYPECNVRIDVVTVVMGEGRARPIITHLQNVL